MNYGTMELWNEVHHIVQETGIKTIPMEKKGKKAKWLSGEALQIAVKRREVKQRRKGKIQTSECRVPKNSKEMRKPSSVINAKTYRKTTEWERLGISSRRPEIPKEHFMQR